MTLSLTELARIPTSGARAVESFELGGDRFLVIPQLAIDADGAPAGMNGGDSHQASVRLVRRTSEAVVFEDAGRLEVPGGEDAEFFRIGDRAFLAVASIRDGSGPYDYAQPQRIFEWTGARFTPFQSVPGYAAKQWRHVTVDGRHLLCLAQGVSLPGHSESSLPSRIYEWTGDRFELLQDVDSAWGYNWHAFGIGGRDFLAYADHVRPSVLLQWDGNRYVQVQDLVAESGRAFASFRLDGVAYLAVARLAGPSVLLRWSGDRFEHHQALDGAGGRELKIIVSEDRLYLIRVNFITGTPQAPVTALESQIYQWHDGKFEVAARFGTSGGTDAAVWDDPELGTLLAVSNSLSPDVRFATDTIVYRLALT